MTTYLLWAAGERLIAESLEELAEIYECATDAGDAITRLRAIDHGRSRHLTDPEYARLLELAFAAHHATPCTVLMARGFAVTHVRRQ